MLSFKALSEKKTKIILNPKLKDVMEKKGCNHTKKGMECPAHGMDACPDTEMSEGKKSGSCGKPAGECMCDKEKTPAQRSVEGKGGMTEAKKKDDSYLETDFKKRQKNNEKARKDLMKGPQMKNPHFESTEENAYVSQEEVSEESTKESETETFLTFKQFTEGKSLSIDDQMRISREYNRKSPEEKRAANKKAMGNVKKVAPKKDTRTDAQKMTDATGPRPGSRYRGD